jgi:flagellar protein FlgJ
LRAACADVEPLFFSQILREMRASIPDDGIIPRGEGETMFRDLLDQEYARQIGKDAVSGLGHLLYQQLSARNVEKSAGIISVRG